MAYALVIVLPVPEGETPEAAAERARLELGLEEDAGYFREAKAEFALAHVDAGAATPKELVNRAKRVCHALAG